MPTFTETKVLQSIEIFPALNVINVKHLATTFKDGAKFTEQVEAKSYSTSQFSDFEMEVAPTGGTLEEIVAGFSEAALTAASELPATLAAKDAEIARLTALIPTQVAAPVAAPFGPSVSSRQIRQALTQMGLRAAVEAAVAAGDLDLKDWWFHSNAFERERPQVAVMAQALGVSDTQLDALWALAATL